MKIVFYFYFFIIYFFYLSIYPYYFLFSPFIFTIHFSFEVNKAWRARRVCARHRPKRCSPRGGGTTKNNPPVRQRLVRSSEVNIPIRTRLRSCVIVRNGIKRCLWGVVTFVRTTQVRLRRTRILREFFFSFCSSKPNYSK